MLQQPPHKALECSPPLLQEYRIKSVSPKLGDLEVHRLFWERREQRGGDDVRKVLAEELKIREPPPDGGGGTLRAAEVRLARGVCNRPLRRREGGQYGRAGHPKGARHVSRKWEQQLEPQYEGKEMETDDGEQY